MLFASLTLRIAKKNSADLYSLGVIYSGNVISESLSIISGTTRDYI